MNDIDFLLEKARSLGQALANHARVRNYFAARRALSADPEARQLLQDYQAHSDHVRQLAAARKPIGVADKHKLTELEGQMASHAVLKQLVRAQADYIELMDQVNRAIEEPAAKLMQTDQPTPPQPTPDEPK